MAHEREKEHAPGNTAEIGAGIAMVEQQPPLNHTRVHRTPMSPFSVVSYCQSSLPSLQSLPSTLLQRKNGSGSAVGVIVQTSPPPGARKAALQQQQQQQQQQQLQQQIQQQHLLPPHTSIPATSDQPDPSLTRTRCNPQAILPEFEQGFYGDDGRQGYPTPSNTDNNDSSNISDGSEEKEDDSHSDDLSDTGNYDSKVGDTQSPLSSISRENKIRKAMRRHSSFPTVQSTPSSKDSPSPLARAPEAMRASSMDISHLERAQFQRPLPEDTIQATASAAAINRMKSSHLQQHKRSSSASAAVLSFSASSLLSPPSSPNSSSMLSSATSSVTTEPGEFVREDALPHIPPSVRKEDTASTVNRSSQDHKAVEPLKLPSQAMLTSQSSTPFKNDLPLAAPIGTATTPAFGASVSSSAVATDPTVSAKKEIGAKATPAPVVAQPRAASVSAPAPAKAATKAPSPPTPMSVQKPEPKPMPKAAEKPVPKPVVKPTSKPAQTHLPTPATSAASSPTLAATSIKPSPTPPTTSSTVTPASAALPPAPSTSFLSSLGRSRSMIPSIPRPSPLMPFRAARSMVNSVTSVGTGLLPSKEQLGALPVAGRILKHPVTESTLTFLANKASERGIDLSGLAGVFGPDPKKAIPPEDVQYRKLNKKLVHQAITLSVLAMQKEEMSKTLEDEAGDDAFELYLATVTTLLHALPFETCDPLRREAFITQLQSFMDNNKLSDGDGELKDNASSKKSRRRCRRRHRRQRAKAATLIEHHTLVAAAAAGAATVSSGTQKSPPTPAPVRPRDQHWRQEQKNLVQQKKQQQQQQLQKELENRAKAQEKEKAVPSSSSSRKQSMSSTTSSSTARSSGASKSKTSSRHHRHRQYSSEDELSECEYNNSPSNQGHAHHAGRQHQSHSGRGHRHRHHRHRQSDSWGNAPYGPSGTVQGGISDTIINTAVNSAIRLKQSPIPDVVASCLRTSKHILTRVDERFRLQDKAWELSKNSIERAIELDEQYAIHEAVTETVFATITGLVKAGIAYKETPSYQTVKAGSTSTAIEDVNENNGPASITTSSARSSISGASLSDKSEPKPQNPQGGGGLGFLRRGSGAANAVKRNGPQQTLQQQEQQRQQQAASEKQGFISRHILRTQPGPAVVAASSDSGSDSGSDSEDSDLGSDSEETSAGTSSGSYRSTDVDGEDDNTEVDSDEEPIELNRDTLRPLPEGASRLSASDQVREKIDMLMAFKGAASLFVGSL
ncbi:hypothetical protein BGW38_008721 [Lunasporangiospora selenospora]|uniref:Uncharacterized protein n=1 Tax=Lunasporangiospora selenospora TaxID=979761 RepID=A0A9P6FXV4_9FUNG|nr:hypothetical protein BGW38_008721 [Lunasporangiospora selenospora]